ncbi:alpha/beta hydrolase [Pseudomonas salmasensis]|uniref:Alpha/beta hydrolase n=1 Tax=Pseudomonas salmasensis TaxID=2745514 RepID=A0ABU5FH81_9PSED|nr:alpha/beta hydrolase [Pseudomonas salmasensis]MDY4301516.1 alpha/beta hydrolase [Pseudomonas salmasensis]
MDRPLMTPEGARIAVRDAVVMDVQDHWIEGPERRVRIRLYRQPAALPASVLLYFHGGGWVAGDLDTHDSFCRIMCEWARCAVVAVDYARPPEYRFPAAVQDCYAVTEWAATQGCSLGLDSTRLAVAGGGSGGGLAAVICQIARDRCGPYIGFQMLLYPVLDCLARNRSRIQFATGFGLTAEMLDWYLAQYVNAGQSLAHPWLSPARHASLHGLPEALILSADCDLLRDEGRAYARQLKKAGVRVRHTVFRGMQHGFINYPGKHHSARKAIRLCAQALIEHFDLDPGTHGTA